eukprot:TRINITY_DN3439_c0_g1_i1.p1 TRINITY_DN3439_c0_g1~~TRINITY_DN3439_c0_g1_i1.p1  ORF type:complete len:454 (+),score=40.57 TRINITY_DN3439_c0_g1_i1:62-1423(+)
MLGATGRRWLVLATLLTGLCTVYYREGLGRRPAKKKTKQCDLAKHDRASKSIDLSGCKHPNLATLPEFTQLEKLDLGSTGLETTPVHQNLKILLLGGNKGLTATGDLTTMSSLHFLGMRGCGLKHVNGNDLPTSLTSVVFTDNSIESLQNLDNLINLRKLMLSHNKLTEVPVDLPVDTLELIRISANPNLQNLPTTHSLWSGRTLAWIACSGTRIQRNSDRGEILLDLIHKNTIHMKGYLGSGASGTVQEGTWQGHKVAVKTFKQASSDGKSTDEIEILKRIHHDDIVLAYGIIENPLGVVVELVDGAKGLGRPPSMDTVVRNIKPNFEITENLVVSALNAVYRAMVYLHSRGVAHGDLYAHNILWTETPGGDYNVKLSDFGASWFVPHDLQRVVQAVEVRAFGTLADDLREWCGTGCTAATSGRLSAITVTCHRRLESRPTFDDLRLLVELL